MVRKKHPGSNSIGANVRDGWHTRAEAAVLVGRDSDTLKRWKRKAEAGDTFYDAATPSGYMQAGLLKVALYSDEDVEALRLFADNQKSGRRKRTV